MRQPWAGRDDCCFNGKGVVYGGWSNRWPARANAILLASYAEADLCRQFCPDGLVLGIPNGVDLEYFRPPPQTHGALRRRALRVESASLDYPAERRWSKLVLHGSLGRESGADILPPSSPSGGKPAFAECFGG